MASQKPKDWHSRRYRTPEAHNKASAAWRARQEEKKASALERQEVAAKRTPQEQLERLDKMFGQGNGAVKERAKLARRLAALSEKPQEVAAEDKSEEQLQEEKRIRAEKQRKKEAKDKK